MHATTVAVDLAKSVFQLAVADGAWKIVETHRLTRTQFERWFANRDVGLVVMEACGSAHYWVRWLERLGIAVKLLPVARIRAYVKRNKTDAVHKILPETLHGENSSSHATPCRMTAMRIAVERWLLVGNCQSL